MDINKLIAESEQTDQPQIEVSYNEVKFLIGFILPKQFDKLKNGCVERRYDDKMKTSVPTINREKFSKKFANLVIKGWEGMTLRKLVRFVYLKLDGYTKEQLDAEVPYDKETAVLLLLKSQDFNEFIGNTCTDSELFSMAGFDDDPDEEEEESEEYDPEDTDAEKN